MISDRQLRRCGVTQPERIRRLFESSGLSDIEHIDSLEICADIEQFAVFCARAHDECPSLINLLQNDAVSARRLAVVLGFSSWWGDYLLQHPNFFLPDAPGATKLCMTDELWRLLPEGWPATAADEALESRREEAASYLRMVYRRRLFDVIADDLLAENPYAPDHIESITARLSEAADEALQGALYIARRLEDPDGEVPLCIIAMGKTGGGELNYVSDVDVMYVLADSAPTEDAEVTRLRLERATRIASLVASICSSPGKEPPLWSVDANLRPEGRDGALVRTIDSYRAYWERWAQNWEFQALLKARPCAGDMEVGQRFLECAAPFIWEASARPGFVDDVRSMRAQVENSVPPKVRDSELKLGVGGLRDIEFSIQFLQLVHGRNDIQIRQRSTLGALGALSARGYIARTDAANLREAYAFLRTLEHRSQLLRMHRTHTLPTGLRQLERLLRSLHGTSATVEQLHEQLRALRLQVRELHHSVFFRPIIAASARLDEDLIHLDDQAAMDRLRAIGYLDPRSALKHIESLCAGTSRRAMIQRHLLPVLLSWIADGANPDMGLLNFRVLSDEIGDSHWYLALLRDSDYAASQLCRVLSASAWIGSLIRLFPEAVSWLDSAELLATPSFEVLSRQMRSVAGRAGSIDEAIEKIRLIRTREVLRIALREATGSKEGVGRDLCVVADACVLSALETFDVFDKGKEHIPDMHIELCALGSYGARELSYTSDLDVLAIVADTCDASALRCAHDRITRLKQLLSTSSRALPVALDFALRPEGKNGALVRTLESYTEYYERWAHAWEKQMLVRLRPLGGGNTADALYQFAQAYCFHSPLNDDETRDIQLMKVRVERERIPGGINPRMHIKLGPGGLSDIQWLVELLQLQLGSEDCDLRTSSTRQALLELLHRGKLTQSEYQRAASTWEFGQELRRARVIAAGPSASKNDVIPSNSEQLVAMAMLMGYSRDQREEMTTKWLTSSRKMREVFEKLFWNIS